MAHKSYAQKIAIAKSKMRAAAGDQHYNHAWRSLDTAEIRLIVVQRSHKEKKVCLLTDNEDFTRLLYDTTNNLIKLKHAVKKAVDFQRRIENNK